MWKINPTNDLYFLNSCRDLVQTFWRRNRPIKRIGDHTFKAENHYLVIRDDDPEILDPILKDTSKKLIYLIDDNIWEAQEDTSLSKNYRHKIQSFKEHADRLIAKADHVVVSSSYLKKFLPDHPKVSLMRPAWGASLPNGNHYSYADKIFNLVHIGTTSHRAGYRLLRPVVKALLERHDHVTFTYHSNEPLMEELDQHPRVKRRQHLRWAFFQRHIGKYPYHLALYPIADTPLNKGRSINKILEHPLSGCAGVYTQGWIHEHYVQEYQAGLSLPASVEAWVEGIHEIIESPKKAEVYFQNAGQSFDALNRLDDQRRFWKTHLLRE
ncbi:hypothetical protein QGN29_02470 [Temperatibacter marinus]|uniref:Uncharacterized protein n=1 Tax=Temperatibacter marinus TaxID=1456591 RepID=A0AA52HA44_9PROT|nr:hypothetical protein [Temperatibacter marinus]WND03232.1 hypothetical protein QGN29_02470 [Temperatibacter marinus]